MRWFVIGSAVAAALLGGPALAQSAAELRAQYQETMELLNQAESMGVDPAMVASLRETLEGLRESIDEQERSEREEAMPPPETASEAPPPSPDAPLEPNLAAATCADFGITEDNYRTAALSGGDDVQMKTLCGQAMEYYSMYKRAMAQKHPEAWRTYDAHKAAAMQLNAFDRDTRAAPGEGIHPDTKTAVQVETERRDAQARADAEAASIPRPPQAPPCKGCASPQ